MSKISDLLYEIEDIIGGGINKKGVIEILDILKCPFPIEILDEIKLYGDYLPKNVEENSLVIGSPAKKIRDRKNLDTNQSQLKYIWLHNGEFQD